MNVDTVQPAELEYVACDKAYVSALRDRIERTLMEKFAHEWRTGYGIAGITHWNRGCVQDLRKLLERCVPYGHAALRTRTATRTRASTVLFETRRDDKDMSEAELELVPLVSATIHVEPLGRLRWPGASL